MNFSAYNNCQLCPRECRVNRNEGELGYCHESSVCRVASCLPHSGEEPSFSGTRGSGTIFFTGCTSGCFFCQNYQISHLGKGNENSFSELYEMTIKLVEKQVHNINFVTPTHFWPHIAALCEKLRDNGVILPFIYNCSGYQKPDMVDEYSKWIDIFMPDFKFSNSKLAMQCMGDDKYPDIALASIRKMIEAKGFLKPWDPTGKTTAQSGVLVRHLVLPENITNSFNVLNILQQEFGCDLPISVMSQFRPHGHYKKDVFPARMLAAEEYQQVYDMVEELGFEHAYVQSIPDTPDFMPDFEKEQPFEGNLL